MKKYTKKILKSEGYKIEKAQIKNVSLDMKNHGYLSLFLELQGNGWSVDYGGYCLGKGYLGAPDDYFKGSKEGMESIMRIMDVVGVDDLFDMKNRYVRVPLKTGALVKIIGNITKEKWFDYQSFFEEGDEHM